jgi:hypothetical protein
VRSAIREELTRIEAIKGLSSLAEGTDQIFAEECLAKSISVTAIIPFKAYETCFKAAALESYHSLLARCERQELDQNAQNEQVAFYGAGRFIVNNCDILIAVWDGKPSQGLGGTADIVAYAKTQDRKITIIDPILKRLM